MASIPTSLLPDESRAFILLISTIATTIIAFILTALRIYVRVKLIKHLDWDDLFNVLGMATALVVMSLIVVATNHGIGRHAVYLNPAEASYGIMCLRIAEFMLIISTVFVKISICLFLMKLFVRSRQWRYFLWSFIAFNTITSMLIAAFIFPQCTPVELNWNKSVKGHCWSNGAINGTGIMQGTIATVTDLTLSILPTVFLWNIRIIWRVKAGICAIMALGFASGGFAIARTMLGPGLTESHDPTWDLVPLFMWAVLEANFGVIAAAAPSARALLGGATVSTTNSRSKSRSLPLKRNPSGAQSQSSYLQLGRSRAAGAHDEEEFGGDESEMLRYNGKNIVKTTNFRVVRSEPREQHGGLSRNSSDEILVPDPTYFVSKH